MDDLEQAARRLRQIAKEPPTLAIVDDLASVWAEESRRTAPVDTGQLRARTQVESVDGRDTRGDATIVSDVPYAGFQEYGTRYMPPNPYFRRGRDAARRRADELGVKVGDQIARVLDSGGSWNPRNL